MSSGVFVICSSNSGGLRRIDAPLPELMNALRELKTLFETHMFALYHEKTRYGSASGRNWNLGLMLNKENQITIGHKRKKEFKAMLDNYIRDRKSGNSWNYHDIQVLGGLISYYKMVEKDYINYLLKQYSDKHGEDIEKCIKVDLSA